MNLTYITVPTLKKNQNITTEGNKGHKNRGFDSERVLKVDRQSGCESRLVNRPRSFLNMLLVILGSKFQFVPGIVLLFVLTYSVQAQLNLYIAGEPVYQNDVRWWTNANGGQVAPDGVTDNTFGISNAVNYALTNGSIMNFFKDQRGSNYLISGSILLSNAGQANWRLTGDATIQQNTDNIPIFELGGTYLQFGVIDGLFLTYKNAQAYSHTNAIAIDLIGTPSGTFGSVNNNSFRNLLIQNAQTGIAQNYNQASYWGNRMENVRFYDISGCAIALTNEPGSASRITTSATSMSTRSPTSIRSSRLET
jgi:hypothetical protein